MSSHFQKSCISLKPLHLLKELEFKFESKALNGDYIEIKIKDLPPELEVLSLKTNADSTFHQSLKSLTVEEMTEMKSS